LIILLVRVKAAVILGKRWLTNRNAIFVYRLLKQAAIVNAHYHQCAAI
jgi:hypothetical protein